MPAKKGLRHSKLEERFRPASENTENVSRWAVRTRVHAGSEDAADVDSGHAAKRGWATTIQTKEVGSGAVERELREKLIAAARRREIDVVLVLAAGSLGPVNCLSGGHAERTIRAWRGLVSLTEALDLTTPTRRVMAGLLSFSLSSSARVLRERIRAGILEARHKGTKLGRPLTAAKKAEQIRKLHRAGVSKAEIARQLNIGRTSMRRVLAAVPQKRVTMKTDVAAPTRSAALDSYRK